MTGYSGTSLASKLGIGPGAVVYLRTAPDRYHELLAPLPEGVTFSSRPSKKTDLVQLFVVQKAVLATSLRNLRRTLRPDAVVWVSWPKKAAKVPTDITEETIRNTALPLGFVDVKVCAVTEIWSGLKLVVRKELR